jgi:PAS domain S-box-containing protein
MEKLKCIILSFITIQNPSQNLTFEQERILQYINYGAILIWVISILLALTFMIIGIEDSKMYYWFLGFGFAFTVIPIINKYEYYNLSKALGVILLTLNLVTWNLYTEGRPYYLLLPFIITISLYSKLWIRISGLVFFYTIYNWFIYFNEGVLLIDYLIYDFVFFAFIMTIVLFLENSVGTYEEHINKSLNYLNKKHKNLKQQHKLKKSEQFFTSFFENSQLGFVILNKKGIIINVNDTFTKQVEIVENDLLASNFLKINRLNEIFVPLFDSLLEGEIKHFEVKGEFVRQANRLLIADLMVNGVYNRQGDFIEAIITVQDITATNEAKIKLEESESTFRALFDNSPLGITIRTVDTKTLIGVNQKILDKLEITKTELIEMKREQFLENNLTLEEDEQILNNLINNELSSFSNEMSFFTKKNQPIYVDMTRTKIIINGQVCIMAVYQDITERKLIEQERKMRYQEMQTFFDALPISFIYMDINHKLIRINKNVQDAFDEPLEGKYLTDIFPEFEEHKYLHTDVIKSGIPIINSIEQFRLYEKNFWQKVSRIPVKDENGMVKGLMVFSTDITAIKDAEANVVLKNAELEHYIQTNLQLESFAYIASHDLKEPLRMIYSFTQLLHRKLKTHFDKDAEEYMGFVLDGTQRMQNLLDDLLEYSTIGRKEIGLEIVNLNDTVYNVIQNLQLMIEEKKAQIDIAVLPNLKVSPIQMIQLFQNLISNALKFVAAPKTPRINIKVEEKNDEFVFSISDNGIGIESEYSDKIFLVFKRLHGKTEYKGTGIGLATCKKIIDNHGGKIWLDSEVGVGTTFYFSIKKSLHE